MDEFSGKIEAKELMVEPVVMTSSKRIMFGGGEETSEKELAKFD